MKRVVGEQRLGFFATVCEDGSPNLSPKGTTYVLDDDHLLFAEIRSPQTVANIRRGPAVEVNVVDPFVRIVVIEVREARALVSPAYGDGITTEAESSPPTGRDSLASTGMADRGSAGQQRLRSTRNPTRS